VTGQRYSDTVIVDHLAAWLNRQRDPSGADTIDYLSVLIAGSGRPLLADTWDLEARIEPDRYGVDAVVGDIGDYTIRAAQATDADADLVVAISTPHGDDHALVIVVDGRTILPATPPASTGSAAPDPTDNRPTHQEEHS
jgi:hypothetical protein